MLFLLTAAASAIGPGATLATALIAPFAMSAGSRIGQGPFLISIMVCHGAGAGFLSPFSSTGAVAAALFLTAGFSGQQYRTWAFVALAHAAVAMIAFLLLGGLRAGPTTATTSPRATFPIQSWRALPLLVVLMWIVGTATLGWPLGWSALAAGIVLCLSRVTSARAAIQLMPWKVIALVTVISSAVALLNRTGGLEWFKDTLAWIATPETIHGAIAFVGGTISAYSSTTAVVLPAFLPMIPAIADRFAGVDPQALATSLLIGATLVDVSPLSTAGALCVGAAPSGSRTELFSRLLVWGFSMALVAATICHFAGPVFGDNGPGQAK